MTAGPAGTEAAKNKDSNMVDSIFAKEKKNLPFLRLPRFQM
jgi:hypothetical protein